MTCTMPVRMHVQRALVLLFLGVTALASSRVAAAGDEFDSVRAKIATLRTLPSASFEWQLVALDIAATLKRLPPSRERDAVARAFKPQVESFVRHDVQATADQRIRVATDIWVQRVGKALAGEGLEMRARAHEERGAWIASVDFPGMRESLAKMLATETDLAASAQGAGFDRLDLVDRTSGRAWQFPLGGGERLRTQLLREAAADWGLEQF